MMKRYLPFATVSSLCLALLCALSMSASAQYMVSSKAGFVNRTDGQVMIARAGSDDSQPGRASLGTQMRDGDRLSTQADARAEILLSPGSYLRLDQNTEVRAVNTNWSQMTFELVKGSIIVEVGLDPQLVGRFTPSSNQMVTSKTPLEIITPQGTLFATKDTLVRVDAKAESTWVAVRQGEIRMGTREMYAANKTEKVKRGKLVRLANGLQPEMAKVDKDKIDAFDSWSFARAQILVQANLASLRQNTLLSQTGWFYNSLFGCYTFMPGRRYLVSPYGFGFFSNWADCYWYDPFFGYGRYGNWYPGNGNFGGGTAPNIAPRVIAGVDREPIRREIPSERGVINNNDNGFGRYDSSIGSSRSIDTGRSISTSSAPAAPVVISAPAPTRTDSGSTSMPTRGGGN